MVEAKAGGASGGRPPSYDDYKDLMDDSLNRIIKTVSKSKNKELVTLCQQALGKSQSLSSCAESFSVCRASGSRQK